MTSNVASEKRLLRRPLPSKDAPLKVDGAKAIDNLVEDLNDIFDRNLNEIYDTANENSSYADSTSGSSSIGFQKGLNRLPSPKTAYLKSMMGKKGRSREYTEDDWFRIQSHNSQNGLVQPYQTRGPKPFHTSHSIKQPSLVSLAYLNAFEESQRLQLEAELGPKEEIPPLPANTPNEFTLEDFVQPVPKSEGRVVRSAIKDAVLSRHNYKKLTKLFADDTFKTDQEHIHQIYFSGQEVPAKAHRIPWRQLILEMAAILREEAAQMRENVATAQKAYNKFIKTAQEAAEIVGKTPEKFEFIQSETDVYQYTTARFFDNIERNDSPIEKIEESALITADELAVLDSMVCGGVALSLKAQFLKKLPDISPVTNTLKYLNLSFNELKTIPRAVFDLSQLEILKLRSNPITFMSPEISRLTKLKCLVMAYCNLKTVPLILFDLTRLEIVDFRYNVLSNLPSEVRQLKELRELNLDGNQITVMPCGLLTLKKLKAIGIRNNFMHPLLWKNLTKENRVQTLKDLCCVVISRSKVDINRYPKKVPASIRNVLQPDGICDCCGLALYGSGLKVVRPARKIFGVANVPFLFVCCSPYCLTEFNSNSKNTAQYIYRNSDN